MTAHQTAIGRTVNRRITEQLVGRGVDAFVFVGLHHNAALFALLEDYGRPYVLTWGVDPRRQHPSDVAMPLAVWIIFPRKTQCPCSSS